MLIVALTAARSSSAEPSRDDGPRTAVSGRSEGDPDSASRSGAVPVRIRGAKPRLHYTILPALAGEQGLDDGSPTPLATCVDECRLQLAPGPYRVQVQGEVGSGVRASESTIDVLHEADLEVDPPRSGLRTLGLVMGISGTALFSVGVAGFGAMGWGAIASDRCADCTSSVEGDRKTWTTAAILGGFLAAGAILAPVGWITFVRNGRLKVEPFSSRSAQGHSSPGFRVHSLLSANAMGVSASVRF